MTHKEIKHFVCRDLLNKRGKENRKCQRNVGKLVTATKTVIAISSYLA